MSVVPFTATPGSGDTTPSTQIDAADARQRMVAVKLKLDEVSAEIDAVQTTLASQHDLEQLLKQGRTHLQDLRNRLQQTVSERDKLQAELAESAKAHQRAVEQIERQMDDVRAELRGALAERNRLASQLAEQEASHERFAGERADERATFTRLLEEATSNQREMLEELDGQRQQLDTLREAAMRAQNFAREIMRAHDSAAHAPAKHSK
jgi:DNA repair exonuclease SbcCD ATPase subunit